MELKKIIKSDLFKKKVYEWEPKRIDFEIDKEKDLQVPVMGMYKMPSEPLTGNQISEKYSKMYDDFVYCECTLAKDNKGSIMAYVIDTNNKEHFVGYLSDYAKDALKRALKKNPDYQYMRFNFIGNVHIYYGFKK